MITIMKKYISVLLALMLFLGVFCVTAQEVEQSTNAKAFDLLSALDVIPKEFDSEDVITRAEFVCDVLKLRGIGDTRDGGQIFEDVKASYWAYDEIYTAYAIGLVHGNEKGWFHPDDLLSYQDAELILLRALNYGTILDQTGMAKKDVYVKNAKLMDGVNYKAGAISRGNAYQMLFNAANATYMNENVVAGDWVSYQQEDQASLMETFLYVKRIKGIVYANERTGLSGYKSQPTAYVNIDGEQYYDKNRVCKDFLGCSVEAYVRTDDTDEVVRVYLSSKTKISILDAKDILPDRSRADEYCIVTYDDETGDEDFYDLSPDYDCVYNGVLYEDFTKDIFDIPIGYIKLIDNDNDSLYDIVMIEEYENYFVDTISGYYKTVTDQYTGKLLDLSDAKRTKLLFEDGTPASFEDIVLPCVLSVFSDKNDNYKTVYICRDTLTLVPEAILDTGKEFIANDKQFSLATSYLPYSKIKLSEQIICYFDFVGQVAGTDEGEGTAHYAYLLGVNVEGTLRNPRIRLLDENSVISTYDLDDKIVFNGQKMDSRTAVQNFYNGAEFQRQLIMYYTDEDNKIKKMYKYVDNSSSETYGTGLEFSLDYVSKPGSQYRGDSLRCLDTKFYLNADTKIFCVSKDINDDVKDFSCQNYQVMRETSGGYNFELYNISEDFSVPVMVSYQTAGDAYSYYDKILVVDKVSQAMSENEDILYKVAGYVDGKYTSLLVENEIVDEGNWIESYKGIDVSKLKKGDVIQYKLGMSGRITAFRVFYNRDMPDAFDEVSTDMPSISATNLYAAIYTSYAEVLSQTKNSVSVLTNRLHSGEEHIRTLPMNLASQVYLYDSEADRLVVADRNDNFNNSNVFFVFIMNQLKMVVAYK